MKPRTRLFPFFLARTLVALAFFVPAPAARASTGFMSFATLDSGGGNAQGKEGAGAGIRLNEGSTLVVTGGGHGGDGGGGASAAIGGVAAAAARGPRSS